MLQSGMDLSHKQQMPPLWTAHEKPFFYTHDMITVNLKRKSGKVNANAFLNYFLRISTTREAFSHFDTLQTIPFQ